MNAEYLVSFLYATVLAGTPLLFGTLGEILTEKSGNLNLGVEGMMCMGAVMGFMAGYKTESAMLAQGVPRYEHTTWSTKSSQRG